MIKTTFRCIARIMRTTILFIFCIFISSCGFKSDEAYLQHRLNPSQNCENLRISQNNGYNGTGQNINRQFYKVQTTDNKAGYHSEISQNFLNNSNYMNRITASQNIQTKSCQDQYFKDVQFFDGQQDSL